MMRTDTYDTELWQLVPKIATPEMCLPLVRSFHSDTKWKMVLGAAPTAPASAQSVEPVAWLSSFIHRHPDQNWRRIYTAHTSEKRARDYVSDLIDPKVEPLYTAPSAYGSGALEGWQFNLTGEWRGECKACDAASKGDGHE